MQYLKDEVRNNIAESALSEFMEKGYEKASIRGIAKKASTSVGNIYKYFKSKEDIYESLIGPVYEKLIYNINQFSNLDLREDSESILELLVENIMQIFNQSRAEISTLLNQSKGSKYENCREIFTDTMTDIVTEAMEYELSKRGKRLKENFTIYLLSRSMVDSISIIVKEKSDGYEVRKLILNMINIYYTDLEYKLESEDIKQ